MILRELTENVPDETLKKKLKTSYIYYHGSNVAPDVCPWHQECRNPNNREYSNREYSNPNDQDTMPIIFVVPTEQAGRKNEGTVDISSTEIHEPTTSTRIECEPNKKFFYQNYACALYIRLRLDMALDCQQNTKSDKDEKIPNKKKKISDTLSNFYIFCDKDKSNKLDERERTVGLLTLLKYIDDGENELTADILLPIRYHKQSNKENQNGFDKQEFRTLIIDTLTEYLRIRTFGYSNYSSVKLLKEMDDKIDRITNNIQETLTNHLQRERLENETPFSFTKILEHLGLFLLCFIFLPIVVCYSIIKNLPKNPDPPRFDVIRKLFIILFSIISALASCTVYLIIIEIILYYIYYDDNIAWHVSALETFWPFALIICIVFIAYLYGSPSLMKNDYTKNKQLEQYYHRAELDMLKHNADVIVLGGDKSITMAEWESKYPSSKKPANEKSRNNKKNYWRKLIQIFIKLYQDEKKNTKRLQTVLKIVLLIIILGIAVIHSFVPVIYRTYSTNYAYPTNTTKSVTVQLIEITFIIDDIIIYLIFLLMIMYGYHLYHILGIKLNGIMRQTANSNEYTVMKPNAYYLDLKKEINLDLFLAQLRNVLDMNNTIEYQVRIQSIESDLINLLFPSLACYGYYRCCTHS